MGDFSQIKLFTPSEVSNILRVSRYSIYRWIYEGKIRAYFLDSEDFFFRSGRGRRPRVLIPEFAIQEFLKVNTTDETIEKLNHHQDFLKETLKKLEKETDPKTIKKLLQIVTSLLD